MIINNRAKAPTLSGLWTIPSLLRPLPSNKLTQSLLQKKKRSFEHSTYDIGSLLIFSAYLYGSFTQYFLLCLKYVIW